MKLVHTHTLVKKDKSKVLKVSLLMNLTLSFRFLPIDIRIFWIQWGNNNYLLWDSIFLSFNALDILQELFIIETQLLNKRIKHSFHLKSAVKVGTSEIWKTYPYKAYSCKLSQVLDTSCSAGKVPIVCNSSMIHAIHLNLFIKSVPFAVKVSAEFFFCCLCLEPQSLLITLIC